MFQTVEGDALCLLSALSYALYTLALEDKLPGGQPTPLPSGVIGRLVPTLHASHPPDDAHASMTRFFGLMGATTMIGAFPLVLAAWVAGNGRLPSPPPPGRPSDTIRCRIPRRSGLFHRGIRQGGGHGHRQGACEQRPRGLPVGQASGASFAIQPQCRYIPSGLR